MIHIMFGLAFIVVFYHYFVKPMSYWKDKGIQQTKPIWLFGDSWRTMFQYQSVTDFSDWMYYGSGNGRYGGAYKFNMPILIVKDPELCKQILVKDFEHFAGHYHFQASESDLLWSENLMALNGKRWQDMRSILNPCFTSSKMKAMFPLMTHCAKKFTNHILSMNEDMISVETKDVFTRYVTDIIASTVYGVEVDSLDQPKNPFYMMGKQATTLDAWSSVIEFIKIMAPKLYAILNIKLLPGDVMTFFTNLVEETIKVREEKIIVRPDMIHLLMDARKEELQNENEVSSPSVSEISTSNSLTNLGIAAQAMMFFFGGFETSTSLMSFMAYELAANEKIQIRLRKEILKTLEECGGEVTYEVLMKMEYLDMVVAETLRKWPLHLAADRICTKPYTIEPTRPDEKPLYLERGTCLFFPTYSFHRDPKYFPDPQKFDPERFSSQNVRKIQPYTYMPFGVGPRSCIGSRFALLETKIVFLYLLNSFEVIFTEKSCAPIVISQSKFTISVEGGNWLAFRPLKK